MDVKVLRVCRDIDAVCRKGNWRSMRAVGNSSDGELI